MINLLNYLLISSVFTGGFVLTNSYFDFYISYIPMALFLCGAVIYCKKLEINRNFIYILIIFFFLSILSFLNGDNSILFLLKALIGFILNGTTYYLLIRLNKNNVTKLFRVYLQLACVVAFIGIFQEISYWAGFKSGYDFRAFIPRIVAPYEQFGILRITSIMQEPAHFGTVMAPAIFIAILNIVQKKKYFIGKTLSSLIIISVLLSFSLVAYFGFVVNFILIMFNYRKMKLIAVSAIVLLSFTFIAYKYLPEIHKRIDETYAVITGKMPLEKTNLSTFSFCSNGLVALKSFINNPLIGSGIGSHPFSYDKYILQIVDRETPGISINSKDASSLFFRIISETGLLGISLFFYFIFKFYVSRKRCEYLWMISNSILCLFILNLVRQGNYFYSGFIFFVWMYYFTDENIAKSKTAKLPHETDHQTQKFAKL